eukprot:gnl/MRDRNA2_/MRDRNA2_34116_c0_seq1.p1 gnl/MRDRNA2_/MRDRNA2_34116_c0~~gnl/MRDRNA2_/MRDRNA2_34116_c0_seq1.p1  ORF type:complete len:200 (+),score=28.91 gnl/MRDRNA2_/MRDRNA2_34116_c0_seq1:115-714(+)
MERIAAFPSKHKKGDLKFSWDLLKQLARECFPEATINQENTDFSWWRGHESSLLISMVRPESEIEDREYNPAGGEPNAHVLLLHLNKDPPCMMIGPGEKMEGKIEEDSIGGRRVEYGPISGFPTMHNVFPSANNDDGIVENTYDQPDRRKFQDLGKNDFVLYSNSPLNPMVEAFLQKIGRLEGYSYEYITRLSPRERVR